MLPFLVGFKYVKVAIEHAERPEGESSYSMKRRFNLALETILAFSDKPLRLSVKFGVVLSLLSISAAVIMVILYFFGDLRADGWASLALLISFLSGIIISVLGMVGLYVGQIFEAVKQRPTYIIQEKIN
jgi:dolichol-phosphate mannosyltransferase